ncbi:unnamed protein product, partial [Callosobruchus maculatus]
RFQEPRRGRQRELSIGRGSVREDEQLPPIANGARLFGGPPSAPGRGGEQGGPGQTGTHQEALQSDQRRQGARRGTQRGTGTGEENPRGNLPEGPYLYYRTMGGRGPDRNGETRPGDVLVAGAPVRQRRRADQSLGEDVHNKREDEGGREGDVGGAEPDPGAAARPDVPGGGGTDARTPLEAREQPHVLPTPRSDQGVAHPRERHGGDDQHAGAQVASAERRGRATATAAATTAERGHRRTRCQGEGK